MYEVIGTEADLTMFAANAQSVLKYQYNVVDSASAYLKIDTLDVMWVKTGEEIKDLVLNSDNTFSTTTTNTDGSTLTYTLKDFSSGMATIDFTLTMSGGTEHTATLVDNADLNDASAYAVLDTVYEYNLTDQILIEYAVDTSGVRFETRALPGQYDATANTLSGYGVTEYGAEISYNIDLTTGTGTFSIIDIANNVQETVDIVATEQGTVNLGFYEYQFDFSNEMLIVKSDDGTGVVTTRNVYGQYDSVAQTFAATDLVNNVDVVYALDTSILELTVTAGDVTETFSIIDYEESIINPLKFRYSEANGYNLVLVEYTNAFD